MTVQITNYTYNAGAKTISFNDYGTIDLVGVLNVLDVTTQEQLYVRGNLNYGTGSVASNIFTYTGIPVATSFAPPSNSDILLIYYDDPAAISGGGSGTPYITIAITATPYNAAQTTGDVILLVDATAAGGAVTINLPTAVGNTAKFTIKKIDAGADIVTIDANGAETIDSDATKEILFENTSITIVSDGANWERID